MAVARLVIVTIALAAIAMALVSIRRQEAWVRHDIQRRQQRQMALRRRLWDQRVRIGQLVAPAEVRRRAQEMALDLMDEDETRIHLAERSADGAGAAGR